MGLKHKADQRHPAHINVPAERYEGRSADVSKIDTRA
jgi:hypothetical protein